MDTITQLIIAGVSALLLLIAFKMSPNKADFDSRMDDDDLARERYLNQKLTSRLIGFVGVVMLVVMGVLMMLG